MSERTAAIDAFNARQAQIEAERLGLGPKQTREPVAAPADNVVPFPQESRLGAFPADWDAFTRLGAPVLPVVCNAATPTAPTSKLPQENRGKVPSRYNEARQVIGIPDWTNKGATTGAIEKFKAEPDYGISVVTGHGIVAIDSDVTDAARADEIFAAIGEFTNNELPCRFRANSEKFLVPLRVAGQPSKQVIKTRWGDIEFLAKGQQFIAAGMHPSGVRYEWVDGIPTQLPELTPERLAELLKMLAERFGVAPAVHGAAQADPISAAERQAVLERVNDETIADLRSALAAIDSSGLHYDQWQSIGANLASLGEQGRELFFEWSRTSAKHDEANAEARWPVIGGERSDYRAIFTKAKAVGWVNPRAGAGRVTTGDDFAASSAAVTPAAAGEEGRDAPLHRLNESYAQVKLGGKVFVLHERTAASPTDTLAEYMGVEDFRAWHRGHTITSRPNAKGETKQIELAEEWLRWSKRRKFSSVVFLPDGEAPKGAYNLWRGFAVEPVPGRWTEMKRHMLVNVCQRKHALYEYLLNWLAHAVQHPGQAIEVALVLQGGRGTGKGILARAVGRLFGPHFYHASRADEIVGQFNAHLEQTALLFADEAFFAGDRQHGAQMKRLITEPTIAVEQKYLPRRMVQNNLHVIFASNDAWVVPAGLDERRFAVCTMGTEYQQDRAFFKKVVDELNGGGHAAMLHELLHRDIARFDPRAVPQTEGLVQQKIESLSGVDAWLYECLDGCDVAGSDWLEAPLDVAKGRVWTAFEQWQSGQRYGRRVGRTTFYKRLDEVLAPLEHRPRGHNPERDRYLTLPPIGAARAAFERAVRGTPAWSATIEATPESPARPMMAGSASVFD